jgi:1,2-diacylglycerol 3-alpha-glucosyltransferase
MKVAILVPVFWTFDGTSRAVEYQARELGQDNNSVSIFTLAANMKPPQNVELHVLGMPHNSTVRRIYWLILPIDFVKTIKWVPRLKEFDIVYGTQYPMTWLACLAKKFYGVKYIHYNYGIAPPDTFSNYIERTYMRIATYMEKVTTISADEVISISQYLQNQLKKETGLDSKVVYCKVDEKKYYRGINGLKIREKHGLDDDPMVLFVGRISPPKGIHLLIEAFNLVKQEIPAAKLVIVGKHSLSGYSKKLKQMSDTSVIFTGDVSDEDLPCYYAACNVYATATLWEGFDLPLAEAQVCGKPVVAFDIGPHPEVVKDKEAGILVPYKNTQALADAISEILKRNLNVGNVIYE